MPDPGLYVPVNVTPAKARVLKEYVGTVPAPSALKESFRHSRLASPALRADGCFAWLCGSSSLPCVVGIWRILAVLLKIQVLFQIEQWCA